MIGRGGFGTVYRAKLLGQDGFEKDVALKLLLKSRARPKILARFRDEARMLGLVRDRAIVAVDPPTRMDDTWAVVMEFVDGVPTEQLLAEQGPLPVGVVLEVTREIARSLDAVFNQRGPDGSPLRLLHRDLKPANLQLTPTGEIKILDFGIAKAEFAAREAKTLNGEMAGTAGYMAPERLEGLEAPSGDVFSLGTVMRRLLTGDRPIGFGGWRNNMARDEISDLRQQALELAARCQDLDFENRPTMREVEDAAHSLLRQCDDPPLRRWAEENVPPNRMLDRDQRVGTVLTTSDDALGTPPPVSSRSAAPPPPRGRATPAPKPRRPPPPPSLPPPVSPGIRTVKPKTINTETPLTREFPKQDTAAAKAEAPGVGRPLPLALLAIPAGLIVGIVVIIAIAALNIRAAAGQAHQAEQDFIQHVGLEVAAMAFSLERAGASPARVQGDITRHKAEPTVDSAIELVQGWERMITVLPPAETSRVEADRRDLKLQVQRLEQQHALVLEARSDWRASVTHTPGILAVALGLAERPPPIEVVSPEGLRAPR